MTPVPTGRLLATPEGRDLVLTRTFAAPVEDVWASITEPERTARWFASWSGEAGPGKVVRLRLVHEEGTPESDMTILACEPPHHLAVTAVDEYGSWRLEARLAQDAGVTTLTLTHHLDPGAELASTGPGWEYYLDMLAWSRGPADEGDRPAFDDYYPSQKAYFEGLTPE
jgi:uncharacterized protein YndB with AHSA1/START domain